MKKYFPGIENEKQFEIFETMLQCSVNDESPMVMAAKLQREYSYADIATAGGVLISMVLKSRVESGEMKPIKISDIDSYEKIEEQF